jgi:hypothetical protein
MTRFAVPWVATTSADLTLAAGIWVVGQAQYINDDCTTRAPQPNPANPEALGGRPAYLDGPVTIRCEYDQFPAVEVTGPLPLVGAVVLTILVIAGAVVVLQWARQASGTRTPANTRRALSR